MSGCLLQAEVRGLLSGRRTQREAGSFGVPPLSHHWRCDRHRLPGPRHNTTRPAGSHDCCSATKFAQHALTCHFLGHCEHAGRTLSRSHSIRPSRRQISRAARRNMATMKPTTPLLTPNKAPLKPTTPLRPKNAPKTPISRPQRRWRFQTTGPPRLQHPHAAPVGGDGTRSAHIRMQFPHAHFTPRHTIVEIPGYSQSNELQSPGNCMRN